MFVRIKKRNNTDKKAVQIVQSFRDGDKVRQKVIQTVGYAFDDETIEHLKLVALNLKTRLEQQSKGPLFPDKEIADIVLNAQVNKNKHKEKLNVNIGKLVEKKRIITGIHDIYGKVYDILGFKNIFSKRYLAADNMLFNLVMARLTTPLSKRASVSLLENDFGINLNLDKVYRMMDKIDDKIIDKIKDLTYSNTASLLKNKIKVAFYDCTTLYFESFSSDELKQNGFSKDAKFNQPQVLLALIITEFGLPLGYEVFSGSTYEGSTLKPVLSKIKEKYNLNDLIVVADSGLLSKENIKNIEDLGLHYILGARVKNLKKKFKDTLLNNLANEKLNKDTGTKSVDIDYEGKRLIGRYNLKRAIKDEHDRNKGIEKLNNKLEKSKDPKSLLSNFGYKKFITCEGDATLELNEELIEEQKKWDGISGVITNLKDMPKEDVVANYKNLWQIENSFRIQKHDLRIRPIYHWTPQKVKAHIAMCFMSFSCQEYLRYRLKLQKVNLSTEKVRNSLAHIQLSILEHKETKAKYGIPASFNKDALTIYKVMRTKYDITPFFISSG